MDLPLPATGKISSPMSSGRLLPDKASGMEETLEFLHGLSRDAVPNQLRHDLLYISPKGAFVGPAAHKLYVGYGNSQIVQARSSAWSQRPRREIQGAKFELPHHQCKDQSKLGPSRWRNFQAAGNNSTQPIQPQYNGRVADRCKLGSAIMRSVFGVP